MTAITVPEIPVTPISRLRWAVADTLMMVRRALTYVLRSPGELIGGLLFPIVTVLLFGYVFGSAIAVPGGGNYREFLMPGLFASRTPRRRWSPTPAAASPTGSDRCRWPGPR